MTFPFHILKILASKEKIDKSGPKCLKFLNPFVRLSKLPSFQKHNIIIKQCRYYKADNSKKRSFIY